MRELRRTLHRPWSPPVPKFAVQIGARLMGTEPGLAFASQRARPGGFWTKALVSISRTSGRLWRILFRSLSRQAERPPYNGRFPRGV